MEFYPDKLKNCDCGKKHIFPLKKILSASGAIKELPAILKEFGLKKPFVACDENTYRAAGEKVLSLLKESGFRYSYYIYRGNVEPNEIATEKLTAAFDSSCDCVIGVGSGVINDICKILAHKTDRFYIIVATAPSMDGYASATSSMAVKGLKVSLKSKCPDVIIGDTEILKNAPEKLLKSGLGDMLAKFVSIAEWRISHEINGEYYCENVAELVRFARDKCAENAKGLMRREENAVRAVFDGLIIGGVAMAYAGLSRPASGSEHYVSHLIDMRGLAYGTATNTHGIQCAVATLYCARLYEKLFLVTPNFEKGKIFTENYDYAKHLKELAALVGRAAESMAELEQKEGKYNPENSAARREIIIKKWDKILQIVREEIPPAAEIERVMKAAELPLSFGEAGIKADFSDVFKMTKDIRDKYVLSSLLWDIGELEYFVSEKNH